MKTAIEKTKLITIGLVSVFIMGLTQSTFSNPVHQNPVELKTLSTLNKQPMFELKMNNTEPGEFLVRVKDGNGDVLYSEILKGKNVSRKYLMDINQEELYDAFHVRFEITSVKTHETIIYNITRNSHLVQDIIVAKL